MDEQPSTRDPFGHIPYPGTPPTPSIEVPVHHELVGSTGVPPSLLECSCGLRVEGPEAQHVMDLHIMEENDWEE